MTGPRRKRKQPAKKERRRFVRFPAMCRVDYEGPGGEAFGFTVEISSGGCFLRGASALQVEDALACLLHLEDGKAPVKIACVVRRVSSSGAGLEFKRNQKRAVDEIRRYIEVRLVSRFKEDISADSATLMQRVKLAAHYREVGRLDDAFAVYRLLLEERPLDQALHEDVVTLMLERLGDVGEEGAPLLQEVEQLIERGLGLGESSVLTIARDKLAEMQRVFESRRAERRRRDWTLEELEAELERIKPPELYQGGAPENERESDGGRVAPVDELEFDIDTELELKVMATTGVVGEHPDGSAPAAAGAPATPAPVQSATGNVFDEQTQEMDLRQAAEALRRPTRDPEPPELESEWTAVEPVTGAKPGPPSTDDEPPTEQEPPPTADRSIAKIQIRTAPPAGSVRHVIWFPLALVCASATIVIILLILALRPSDRGVDVVGSERRVQVVPVPSAVSSEIGDVPQAPGGVGMEAAEQEPPEPAVGAGPGSPVPRVRHEQPAQRPAPYPGARTEAEDRPGRGEEEPRSSPHSPPRVKRNSHGIKKASTGKGINTLFDAYTTSPEPEEKSAPADKQQDPTSLASP